MSESDTNIVEQNKAIDAVEPEVDPQEHYHRKFYHLHEYASLLSDALHKGHDVKDRFIKVLDNIDKHLGL